MGVLKTIKNTSKFTSGILLSTFNKELGKKYIFETLASIPGLSAKAAQLLSLKLNIDEKDQVLVEEMPAEVVSHLIEERSPELFKNIGEITSPGITASIGQVNKVLLKNGVTTAVKLRYPGIKENLESQLGLLFKTLNFGPPKKYGLNIEDYRTYLTSSFSKELDYMHEAKIQMDFFRLYENTPRVIIPEVFSYYSGEDILTQKWVDSAPPSSISKWNKTSLQKACEVFIWYFLDGLFIKKNLHMDLHKNNFGFLEDEKAKEVAIVLYDFGSTLSIPQDKVQALYEIILHFKGEIKINLVDHLIFLGFDKEKISYIAPQIPTILERLVSPFTDASPWSPKSWELKSHIEQVLKENKWWFRTAGPAWFLMLMRSAQGLISFLNLHDLRFFTSKMFDEVIKNYKETPITVPKHGLIQKEEETFNCAKYLKVRVLEHGLELVSISLPYKAVDNLREYIPEASLDEIEEEIDIISLTEHIQTSGYQPQIIFEKHLSSGKHYKVWLE